MPITKRANGTWQVSVGFGGRTLRRSSRHWTHADAKRVEAKLIGQARLAASGQEPDRTLADALEKWLLEHVPKLRSKGNLKNKARRLLPFIAGRPITDAPRVWSEIKAKNPDKAPATLNHYGRILRQLCNLAQGEWAWTDAAVGKRIRLLPETPRETFLTLEEVEALAAAAGPAGELVLLAAYTGIRRGHLLRLTRHDVKGDHIILDRSSKTRTLQAIPIHPRVADTCKRLPLGISDWQLTQHWTAARAACDLQGVRWHDLRHTCASWLVQAGVSIYDVQKLLGHSSIAVTMRYAHHAPKQLRDAILKLA